MTVNGYPTDAHVWLRGARRTDRERTYLALPILTDLTPPLSAHRHHGGPYSAANSLLRQLVPTMCRSHPEIAAAHEIEILTVAPDLQQVLPATLHTLTSLAAPKERTRFYSSARTLRIAHGLVEVVQEYLTALGGGQRRLFIDDLHEADYTDQEFVAVLLRRISPALLLVVIGSTDRLADRAPDLPGSTYRAIAGGLPEALTEYCRTVDIAATDAAADVEPAEILAELYVRSDCTLDLEDAIAAYHELPVAQRQTLHEARAIELAALDQQHLTLGPLPLHRRLGSDPQGAGVAAVREALDHCSLMGFYDASLELIGHGEQLCPVTKDFTSWWRFTSRLPTILSAIGLGEQAEQLCERTRALTDDPSIHAQLAYSSAMLYTRLLEPGRQDHERALGWANIAVAIASLLEDPLARAFNTVFFSNGRALIEAHLHRPEVALDLVTRGIERLDAELAPNVQRLHRSVLRYNRAQVLVGMRRYDEALVEYQKVIEVDPHYPEYHFELGSLLHRLGRDDEALLAYEHAARLGPPFPEVQYNRADLLMDLDRTAEALAGFSYVLELEPDNVTALVNRAGILSREGDLGGAELDVARGLSLDPDNAHLLCLKGQIALDSGKPEIARRALDRAIQIDPGLVGAWISRGTLHFAAAEFEAAFADLSHALQLDDSDLTARFNRGLVLQELHRYEAAIQDLELVLEAVPDEDDARQRREECLKSLAITGGTVSTGSVGTS